MTEIEAAVREAHPWDVEFAKLHEHFPGATDGVLFCVHKLQQDPGSKLKDFEPEADLHGLKVTGASFHSARVLLGLDKRRNRRPTGKEDDTWKRAEGRLRKEFPDATLGILFCVYKLRQETSLTIPDFRDEASEHGINLGGRALHSARKLLNLEQGKKAREPRAIGSGGSSLERKLHETLQRMQEEAEAESKRLRGAIRRVIRILEDALEEESPGQPAPLGWCPGRSSA